MQSSFRGIRLSIAYEVKHAWQGERKRWFDKARGEAQGKGNMVEFLGWSMEGDEGVGCEVGRVFIHCTEEI